MGIKFSIWLLVGLSIVMYMYFSISSIHHYSKSVKIKLSSRSDKGQKKKHLNKYYKIKFRKIALIMTLSTLPIANQIMINTDKAGKAVLEKVEAQLNDNVEKEIISKEAYEELENSLKTNTSIFIFGAIVILIKSMQDIHQMQKEKIDVFAKINE